LKATLETVMASILRDWVKPDGSFRSRRLHFGWDNVPKHRWGQAQIFRSLAFYLYEEHSGQMTDKGRAIKAMTRSECEATAGLSKDGRQK